MKTINSFIVDNGKKQTKIELIEREGNFLNTYLIIDGNLGRLLENFYFTKFFAKRRFNKLRKAYKSRWFQYRVYDDIK